MSQPPGSDPNPPLTLPTDIARQVHIASLVFAGATAVFIWDILHCLADDYILLVKHKFRISTATYFVSRIACLTYILGFTLFATYPLADCNAALIVFNSFYPLASSLTSLLFLFRVRAVYAGHPLPMRIFGLLWLFLTGAAITIPASSSDSATKIGSTCIVTHLPEYLSVNGIAMTVYDTSVFLAISYRLLANSHVEQTPGEMTRALFRGAHLHAFSKALFLDGQQYYLITIFTNALTITMVYAPSINPIYRGMLQIPNIALTNLMACRLYRNATLYYVHPGTPPLSLPTAIMDDDSGFTGVSLPLSTASRASGGEPQTWARRDERARPVGVSKGGEGVRTGSRS